MLITDLIKYFEGVKKNGQGFKALCPAHDDHNPSLSISQEEEKILINCHAGCNTESIMQQIGLELTDLFNNSEMPTLEKKPQTRQIEPIEPRLIEELHQGCTKDAQQYLEKQRAITSDVVARYKIGIQNKNDQEFGLNKRCCEILYILWLIAMSFCAPQSPSEHRFV